MVEVVVKSGSETLEHDRCGVMNYPTKDQMIYGWIAMIIVNIIMGILFPHAWWAFIPCFIMNIRAIVITVQYVGRLYHCPNCHRLAEGPATNCQFCGQPLDETDNIHNHLREHAERFAAEMQQRAEMFKHQVNGNQSVSQQHKVVVPVENTQDVHYCTACGTQISAKGQFCPLCGQKS